MGEMHKERFMMLKTKQTLDGQICDVCNESFVSISESQLVKHNYQVCASIACKNIIQQCKTKTSEAARLYLQLQSKLIKERKQRLLDEEKRITELEKQQLDENTEILNHTLSTNPDVDENLIQIVEVPSGILQTATLARKRVEEYKMYLQAIADKAIQYDSSSQIPDKTLHELQQKRQAIEHRLENNPKTKTMSEALCTMCKGGCCTSGKNTAYLTELTIRRFMDDNPELTASQVVDKYLSYLSDSPILNSCINHTDRGCGLPRHMRSDICNGYFCDSVVSFQRKDEANTSPIPILAIQRANTLWLSLIHI